MSLLSQLEKGQITPGQFVKSAAADIKKDFSFFEGTAFGQTLISWAVDALEVALGRLGILSSTAISLIIDEIEVQLGIIPTPAASPAVPTTASPPTVSTGGTSSVASPT